MTNQLNLSSQAVKRSQGLHFEPDGMSPEPHDPLERSPEAQLDRRGTNLSWLAGWFHYLVRAQPHHTDYAGVVWHGSYLTWMEEARVEYLRSVGVDFTDLVAMGCDLPVVDLSVKYHRPVLMGMQVVVKTRMAAKTGVRMNFDYQIEALDGQTLYITAQVTLVGIDRIQGKILRRLPPAIETALLKLSEAI